MTKILIVDDDPDVHFILKSALKKEGYDVVEMSSGDECLTKIDEVDPDLVLLDIRMPDINGWEVCKKIKESNLGVPISMISIRRSADSVKKSLDYAHADRHLTKPLDMKEVLNTIKELV